MNNKGLTLVLTTAVISGFSIYINKFGVSMGNPVVFSFLKNALVALVLFSVILGWKKWEEIKNLKVKNWINLIIIGIIGGGIPFILFFKGLALTSAATGALIHKSMFLYVFVLAFIFLKEKVNRYFFIGAAAVLIANYFVLKNISFDFGWGEALVFLATLFWAAENVVSKKVLEKVDSDILAWGRMFFGSLFILAYLFFMTQAGEILKINLAQIGWALITSIFLFGYVFTWYRGLSSVPVTIATSVLLLGSPVTTILTILSGTKISGQMLYPSLLTILGISLIIYSHEKNRKKFERA